eukprot:TRINITY_DN22941_c0_g1_i1.p1 TRINITY_DN22941_c0_g1~~TRINITY_DN22941_c0_g1_i1.p1  ORF type:complete len:451 (-),score=138.26 TRINITY_DN22941_c0_g1_i1:341-1693(-)
MGPSRQSVLAVALAAAGLFRVSDGVFLRQQRGLEEPAGVGKKGYKQVLHNYQNVQYYADFQIGGQEIAGIFDTGSFELVVRSARCKQCVHPTAPFDHSLSKTYEHNGTVTKHVYGSGPCISVLGYDTVSVGDLHAKEQALWEIMDHRIQILDTAKFAAIVGIGPNFGFGNKERTLLMSFGVEEFSICLQKPSNSVGYLHWGLPVNEDGSPAGLKKGEYVTAQVFGKHHWATKLENVSFAGANVGAAAICGGKNSCSAIVDSGTSLIAAPGLALMQLSEQMSPIMEDCSNLHQLPTLRFVVDGVPFELPPKAYVMRVKGASLEANDIWDVLFFKPKIRKLDMCMPAFMQLDMESSHGPVWILGMPFFRYFHTTFDRKNKVMHFARAGPDCEPAPLVVPDHSEKAGNKTESLLGIRSEEDNSPLEVDLANLVPPTLSEQIDFPFASNGLYDL